MAKKTISNTFTVNTIIDGESAPYYFQEWFAWSNDASTSGVTTPPTIGGSWATSIPSQGSYAYLWRKSIRYVWNENTRQYSSEAAQYFRMSGTDGTSIHTRGQVANASSRGNGTATIITDSGTQTITLSDGDAVTQLDNGHLYQWVTEGGGKWLDLGQFKGESGVTYYTHIAWATNVTISGSTVTVTGFVPTKSPNDTTHIWMGTYVDTNSGQDSANASSYTWSNTKGNKGDDGKNAGEVILTPTTIFFNGDEGRYVYDVEYIQVGVGMKVDGQSCVIGNISVGNTPVGISYTLSGTTITFHNTSSDYGDIEGSVSIVVTGTITSGSVTTTYIATGVLSIVCTQAGEQGETGEQGQRGKIGRFFYFGGTFNAADTTQTFIVNDAQAPYFEHIENGQKRYHVFNYDTNGTYTMAQMWAIRNNWNNKPWESMTNDFKYLITQAIFAPLAHLGSFVISGDYFISQYGTLFYNNNGTIETIIIDASNVSTLFGGSVAYAWFADSDPMVNTMPTTGNYKFRPMKCINALTGEEWMAQGKVHVDADGSVALNDVEVNGSMMYHKVVTVDISWARYTMTYDASVYVEGQKPKMYGDIFILMGNKINARYAVVLPPTSASLEGLKLKIIRGFHSNPTQNIWIETSGDMITIERGTDSPFYNVNGIFDPNDGCFYQNYEFNAYSQIELVVGNAFTYEGTKYYQWVVLSAEEGVTENVGTGTGRTMVFEKGLLKEVQ